MRRVALTSIFLAAAACGVVRSQQPSQQSQTPGQGPGTFAPAQGPGSQGPGGQGPGRQGQGQGAGRQRQPDPAQLSAEPFGLTVQGAQISGPAAPADFSKWIDAMKRWRTEYLKSINYSDSEYKRPELLWTQSAFVEPQMMVEDRYFYDPVAGKYTVDRYLDDLQKRYGGIDAVLVWSEYPNLGIDNRNQYDFIRDLPGGVSGVKQMAADFQRRGVHVLFTYNPWDQGTREEELPPNEAMAKILASVGSDGMNGDTMRVVPLDFRTASDATGRPQVFEPEHLADDKGLAFNNMGWAQATSPGGAADNVFGRNDAATVPKVDKLKWLEPRHLTHISDRWERDKNVDVQYAFFNGLGIMSWENVWGIWNGMTPRDSETFRRVRKIDRQVAPLLVSKDWEPLTPGLLQHGIYASRWPDGGQTLWTIINKNEYDVPGEQLRVPYQAGTKYYDLWHGVELTPAVKDGAATLSFDVEANGYGAVLAVETGSAPAGLTKFLGEMNILARTPLNSYSKQRAFLPQQVVKIASTKPASSAPAGMVKIPAAEFDFQVSGIEIEGSNEIGTDVQYPWENSPRRYHEHKVSIPSFFIDKTPVTNAEFKEFLDATKYHPKDDHNFLKDWKDGTYPAGWEQKPVSWVSIEDARAYAAWAGKRLPHEWEWQYAAQGTDGRIYPWGNDWNDKAVPIQDKGHELTGPDDVNAHPEGASPFGVLDTTGNVWQWTDEYLDEHTRAAILRGGSYYAVQGSRWYFPQAYRLNQHGKLLLMAPGKDRAATVGFRCVVDAAQ